MYDTVMVPCPECGALYGAQSKSGPCECETYTLDQAPGNVMLDVNRHSPFTCECGAYFVVLFESEVIVKNRRVEKVAG